MIDIHCHILHGVDDGPEKEEEALQMARVAVENGISTIIATPHFRKGPLDCEGQRIMSGVETFQQRLDEEGIPLTVLVGQETRLNADTLQELERGEAITLLNSQKYILIEVPSQIPTYMNRMFYEILSQGITPIIAHPEKTKGFVEKPEQLYELINMGALSQITTESIIGKHGENIQQFCIDLCQHNLTHFLATDAHDIERRPLSLKEGYEKVTEFVGEEMTQQFKANAAAVLDGGFIRREQPFMIEKKRKKKSWIASLFSR